MSRSIVSLSGLVLLVASSCGAEPEEKRPDVLFLVVDTLRADHLGCYGYERPTSPVIDELAEHGARFSRNSAQAPWTLPSMSSMLTSRYFTAHRDFPEAEVPTLAESFQEGGYHTLGIVGNTLLEAEHGFGRGFDKYVVAPGSSPRAFPDLLDLLREPLELALTNEERAPLFLYFHAFDPHAPYVAHHEYDEALPVNAAPAILPFGWQQEMLETYGPVPPQDDPDWGRALSQLDRRRGLYDQEIRFTDEHIGVLLQMLEGHGIVDSLLIVLVSDHGEGLWENLSPVPEERLMTFAPDHFFFGGHGHNLSEQALRTPFILAGPGVPPGTQFDEPVENLDLFPTLLTLCDLPRPGDLHGADLTSLFSGERGLSYGRRESFAYIRQFACLRDEVSQLKLVVPTGFGIDKGMRGPTLHHLGADPRERNNLASERPEALSRLMGRLEAHLKRYPTTTARVGERISQQRLEGLGYAGQGSEEKTEEGEVKKKKGEDY